VTARPTLPAGPDALYGLVAWPSPELDGWLRQQQERLGVRAYGEPHLNLRALFSIQHTEEALVSSLRALLGGVCGFEVRVRGWRTFPGVVFLEFERSAQLDALHERVLDLPGAPPQPYDQQEYIPHLTLALGVLPWAQPDLEAQLEEMHWPVNGFRVSALSLTREAGGEVREIHTFPLLGDEE
jgi:2'-5' RNA ligase